MLLGTQAALPPGTGGSHRLHPREWDSACILGRELRDV